MKRLRRLSQVIKYLDEVYDYKTTKHFLNQLYVMGEVGFYKFGNTLYLYLDDVIDYYKRNGVIK